MIADVINAATQMQKEQTLKTYTTTELVKELSSREEVKYHSEDEVVLLNILD